MWLKAFSRGHVRWKPNALRDSGIAQTSCFYLRLLHLKNQVGDLTLAVAQINFKLNFKSGSKNHREVPHPGSSKSFTCSPNPWRGPCTQATGCRECGRRPCIDISGHMMIPPKSDAVFWKSNWHVPSAKGLGCLKLRFPAEHIPPLASIFAKQPVQHMCFCTGGRVWQCDP